MTARLNVQVGSCSDKGIKEENQDSLGFLMPDNLALLEPRVLYVP